MQIVKAQLTDFQRTQVLLGIGLGPICVTFCQRDVFCLALKKLSDAELESMILICLVEKTF